MNDEFELFKKSLENVNQLIPSLNSEYIDLYLSEIDTNPLEGVKPTILIIDDDPYVREALQITLKKKYELILCSSGDEGIEKVSSSIFCVILDVKMDGKSGFETFLEIKKKFPYVPIIFHSAYQDMKSPYEIMNDYHPFGYVIKEGETRELLDTLASAVVYFLQINKNILLVNQLKKMNIELEKSKNKYKDLVENSLDIIFSLDSEGRIISINRAVTNILRFNVKELIGKKFFDLIYKSEDAHQVSLNENIFEENYQELIRLKGHVSFNCDLRTEIGEPKEMHIKMKYQPTNSGYTIFGSAFNIEDDILFRLCESENQVYKIGNYLTQVDIICKRVANACSKYLEQDEALDLKLCLKELLVNSVEHGNLGITFEEKSESLLNDEYFQILTDRQKSPRNKNKKIIVEYSLIPGQVEFRITDEGNGFDHRKIMAKSKTDKDMLQFGNGRGIMMAKEFFTTIEFNERGNSVYLVKKFS